MAGTVVVGAVKQSLKVNGPCGPGVSGGELLPQPLPLPVGPFRQGSPDGEGEFLWV